MSPTVLGSMPRRARPPSSGPAKASPDSLSRTRFQCGDSKLTAPASSGSVDLGRLFRLSGSRCESGADLEPGEPLQCHAGFVENSLHRLLVVPHVGLVVQHDVLVEPVDPPLDDLRERLLRLALLARGRLGDLALLGDHVSRDVVAG